MNALPSNIETLRVPPSNNDAEQAVLGAIMLDPKALAKIADWLHEDDFYRKDHRLIWRAVTSLAASSRPVDPVTLMDWFDDNGLADMIGGSGYLLELAEATASASNVVSYAEIVSQKAKMRAAINIGMTLADAGYSRGADADMMIATASRSLGEITTSRMRGGLEPVKAAMIAMQAELMTRYERGPQLLGQPWPWAKLNDCTKGLRDGLLYVVGARPSMGKSIFALQTGLHNALLGHRTALFSVEMTREECMARAVACVGRIPHDWVENPALSDPDADMHWMHLSEATQRIIESPFLIDETPGITIDQLMARARRAHMQKPLRLILIDHMHDMTIDPKREVRIEYGRIAQGAKTLAKELKCPVVLLSQLNRKNAGGIPSLTDLRESGEIEAKADVVLFLHRPDYYDKDSYLSGLVEVIPAKGRNIRVDREIDLQNVFSEMRMEDWIGERPTDPSPPKTYTRGMR